ncbi:alpha-glucosidase, partial [Streptomyces sp. SP18CS02]|nr:alpha-glucosidase [Streptomyces sp. SP18CS02]
SGDPVSLLERDRDSLSVRRALDALVAGEEVECLPALEGVLAFGRRAAGPASGPWQGDLVRTVNTSGRPVAPPAPGRGRRSSEPAGCAATADAGGAGGRLPTPSR